MKTTMRTLLTALAAATLMLGAGTASADRGGRDDHWEGRGWRGHDHWRGDRHHHRHWRDHDRRVVVRERVVIREQPVYGGYWPAPVYAAPVYADPSVVIGVNLPPIVIPLR